HTSHPVSWDSQADGTRGVPPSRSVTAGVVGPTGSHSRYSSMTPRQSRAAAAIRPSLLAVPPDAVHRLHAVSPVDSDRLPCLGFSRTGSVRKSVDVERDRPDHSSGAGPHGIIVETECRLVRIRGRDRPSVVA